MVAKSIDYAVRERASDRCEYCLAPQSQSRFRFWIDHVIALKHRGATTLANLALACIFCNRHKGANVGGIDPLDGRHSRLFNPRTDRWAEHFRWRGLELVGRSAIGRTTVDVLEMNHRDQIRRRRDMLRVGLWPPPRE
jgi:hypothetical protein